MEGASADVLHAAGTGTVHENKNLPDVSPEVRRVVYVLGGPGSGKTTQCAKFSSELGITHLSAGDLLQHGIDSGFPNGKMIRDSKKEGKLVPLEIMIKLLRQAIWKSESETVLIDGFARNKENLHAAENIMKVEPELVLFLDCSEPESTRRLLNRNQGRVNDNAGTIRKRIEVYNESTLPVIEYYRSKGKLRKRPIEEVYESVKKMIISHINQKEK